MWRIPMCSPSGLLTSSRNRRTLSRLSRGSPIPISTILETSSPESSWVNSTWSSISEAVSRRTSPPRVEAQNLQPMAQPTSEEMQTVLPWR